MPHRTVARAELADLLALLAHPLRLAIVLELRSGERDVTALTAAVDAAQSAVSQALARLRAARLLHVRRDGRHMFYSLSLPGLAPWLDGGLAILQDEAAQMASIHEAIALTRKDLDAALTPGGEP